MNTLKTLRTVSAATILGSLVLVGVKDIKTENIRDIATKENRSLTKEELEYSQNRSIPFYLALGSIPAWLLIRQLDEKKNRLLSTN